MTVYPVLDRVHCPKDLDRLDEKEYEALCRDIRRFLVEHIAKTGGHLASNLGIVELTVALQLEFDTEKDRIIFDVGHQCYVHKLLTGRREGFEHLRNFGGMSGFPKPCESIHDAFVAGHASTSVSAAVGMARARTMLGANYQVCAVIGDGALTGGMAYEALNDAGKSGEPLLVVLNDNEMSISKNVGAISDYLSKIRLKPSYTKLKYTIRRFNSKLFGGERVNDHLHRVKDRFKRLLLPMSIFENMGFSYVGPVDGHDIKTLRKMIQYAKQQERPVLLHIKTVKGKGYKYSEESPERYHGIKTFDIDSGKSLVSSRSDFSSVFGNVMCKLARENQKLCVITAAMRDGTGLTEYAKQYPRRFFDVGIAEEHAVTMAAAMAKQGVTPVFAVYSTFLQRGYDQLIHDVAILHLHVVLAIDRAGITGEDGETHQGVFDVAFLRTIPDTVVLCPASYAELTHALRQAVYEYDGLVAVRYPKGGEGRYQEDHADGAWVALEQDEDACLTMVTYGALTNEVQKAAELLREQGIGVDVIKLYRIMPLDFSPILQSAQKTGHVLVVEDCVDAGSVGREVLGAVATEKVMAEVQLCNIGNQFLPNGSVAALRQMTGLDAQGIYQSAMQMFTKEPHQTVLVGR